MTRLHCAFLFPTVAVDSFNQENPSLCPVSAGDTAVDINSQLLGRTQGVWGRDNRRAYACSHLNRTLAPCSSSSCLRTGRLLSPQLHVYGLFLHILLCFLGMPDGSREVNFYMSLCLEHRVAAGCHCRVRCYVHHLENRSGLTPLLQDALCAGCQAGAPSEQVGPATNWRPSCSIWSSSPLC